MYSNLILSKNIAKSIRIIKSLCFTISFIAFFYLMPLLAVNQPVCLASSGVTPNDRPTLSVSSAGGYRGDRVNIKVTLDHPQDIAGIQFTIKYDTNILDISEQDIIIGTTLKGWLSSSNLIKDEGEIRFAFATPSSIHETGKIDICSFHFTIKASGTYYGDTQILVGSVFIGNGSQKLESTSTSGKVHILQKTTDNNPTSLPQPTPTSTPHSFQYNPIQGQPIPTLVAPIPTSIYSEPPYTKEDLPATPKPPSQVDEPDNDIPGKTIQAQFHDLNKYGWAKVQIEELASLGIIKGTSSNTFSPDANVTRADFLILIVKVFDLKAGYSNGFSDVKPSDYYHKEVNMAKSLGIVQGVGNNRLNPKAKIKRQEMFCILEKALRLHQKITVQGNLKVLEKFKDRGEISAYAVKNITALVEAGFITGNNGLIKPRDFAVRAEAAVLIHKAYHALAS